MATLHVMRNRMNRGLACAALLVATLALAACSDKGSRADPPTDVAVVPADSSATVTWTMSPDVEYWLFYAPAASVSKDNWFTLAGARVVKGATSQIVVTGLTNGTTYSFMIDGRTGSGPGGPASASVSTVPRLAGATWTAGGTAGTQDLRGVAFGTVFVAVGGGGALYSSADGAAWAALASNVTTALHAAIYSGGIYVVAGAGGVMLRSTDAATWTAPAAIATASDLNALATNGAGVTVAVGDSGTIVTSSDGQNWTAAASSGIATTNTLQGVTYGNNRYVAVGAGGVVVTSTDASNWTALVPVTGSDLRSIAYGAGLFVAVGAGGTLLTSTDGTNWTAQTAIGSNTLTAITYGRQFVAVGLAGAIFTSTDGLTWQPQSSGLATDLLAVSNRLYTYVAAGAAGTNLVSK